ncbi:DUF4124 domain-containing protein [Luteimonas abyssi]|uniref:DUF4124 domain-containing protein n=1 Tax=Luteimonas abyssi TaxID=1247514 RepID=UPI000737B4C2|nr:DUF4124 domain-containing protein [Luteimonas abyssi]
MRFPLSGLALGVFALLLPAVAVAQEIYQWKDANGVTHFSETPPASGAYSQRRITQHSVTPPAAAPAVSTTATAAPARPQENPRATQCQTARANIDALTSDAQVQQDDGSGTPRVLSDSERAAQLDFAQAAARAYCD